MKKACVIINAISVVVVALGFMTICSINISTEISLSHTAAIYASIILFIGIGVFGINFSRNPYSYIANIKSISFAIVKSIYVIFSKSRKANALRDHYSITERFILFYNEEMDVYENEHF